MGNNDGVEVTGAGSAEVNGWYDRKELAEGPPPGWYSWSPLGNIQWRWRQERMHANRPWYQKDDGCFIRYDEHAWFIHTPNGYRLYARRSGRQYPEDAPPAQEWNTAYIPVGMRGAVPAPTVTVRLAP